MKYLLQLIVVLVVAAAISVGYYIHKRMEVAPYKKKAELLIRELKNNHLFEAQALLDRKLQHRVSLDDIAQIITTNKVTNAKEIEWRDWQCTEGNCTLQGSLVLDDQSLVDVEFFVVQKDRESEMLDIIKVRIGKSRLSIEDLPPPSFPD